MKKLNLIAGAVLAVAVSSAFAAGSGVTISGDVGVTSNEIYRGVSLSEKNLAVDAGTRIDVKGDKAEVFGALRGSTVNIGEQRGLARGELGLGADLGMVHAELGLRENMNFGGFGSDLNTREAFVRGTMPLAGGTVSAEYNKQIQGFETKYGRPAYMAVGYSHVVTGLPMTVSASVGYAKYDTGTKFNDVTLGTSFFLTNNMELYAAESIGGRYADDTKMGNLTSVGVRYHF